MRIFLGLLTISILLLSGCRDENEWTSAPLRKQTDEPVEIDTTSNQNSPDEPFDWCLQNDCWDETIYTCRDSTMIANFTRNESDGWTGGDATYSIALRAKSTSGCNLSSNSARPWRIASAIVTAHNGAPPNRSMRSCKWTASAAPSQQTCFA